MKTVYLLWEREPYEPDYLVDIYSSLSDAEFAKFKKEYNQLQLEKWEQKKYYDIEERVLKE